MNITPKELSTALTTFIKSGSANGNEAMRKECLRLVPAISLLPDMIEVLRDFITHYAGPKREQLGNGYAYQWYDRAQAILKRIEG